MHSILLIISKPKEKNPGSEQAWKSVAPELQQCAIQAGGVKTLYENCWLIPAEKNGFSFFDHAITVADAAKLCCRVCVLRRPPQESDPWSPGSRLLKRLTGATVRAFQETAGFVLKLMALRGLAG